MGVPLFFMMSGYLFGSTFAADGSGGASRVPSFYRARFRRLYPPYAGNILILWVGGLGLGLWGGGSGPFYELLRSLCGCAYWLEGQPSRINGVAWSLEVELQFYLAAPWVALTLSRFQAVGRVWITGGLCILGLVLRECAGFTDKTLLGNLHFFLGGWLLFLTGIRTSFQGGWRRNVLDLLAMLAVWVSPWLGRAGAGMQWMLLLWAAVLVAGAFSGGVWARFLSLRGLVALGTLSYTVYLYHYPVVSVAGRVLAPLLRGLPAHHAMAVLGLSAAMLVWAVSILFFALFEKPFMRKRKREGDPGPRFAAALGGMKPAGKTPDQ